MKIAATTLLGPGTINQARDALRLVKNIAGAYALIADPREEDGALTLARELGPTAFVRLEPWRDFSHARNIALDTATELGADWALTIDTDESIFLPPNLRDQLAHSDPNHPVAFVKYDGGAYAKERFFRLPTKGQWTGPTHECFLPASYPWILEGASFIELAKSPESLRAKCERDVSLLGPYARKHPKNPRWFYFLGESLKELNRLPQAERAYKAAWELDGWEEESALAAYKAAQCAAPNWKRVLEWCALALARAPWMPEPAWLASLASLERNKPHDAIAWAHLAILHGNYQGRGQTMTCLGHQELIAQWEGPYLALAEAHKRLGDKDTQAHYERLAARAGLRGRVSTPLAALDLHAVPELP